MGPPGTVGNPYRRWEACLERLSDDELDRYAGLVRAGNGLSTGPTAGAGA